MTQVVVTGGSVLDVTAGQWQAVDVRIDGGRIVEVGTGLSTRAVDARGRYVIPGLIDAHVHVTAFSADFRELERNSASYVYARTSAILRGMLSDPLGVGRRPFGARPFDAELVALRVGQCHPAGAVGFAVVAEERGAERDRPLHLLVPAHVGRLQVQVHAVLDRLVLRDGNEQQ